MATYKVTDPTTGKTIRLTGDSPPTEQELENIFNTISPTEEKIPFLPRSGQVEAIAERRPESTQRLLEEVRTPFEWKEHPVKRGILKPVVTGLKAAAIPFQRGEAAIAGLGLGLQKGQPREALRMAGEGLRGKKAYELGDIVRTTGFGKELNEFLAAPVGFFAGMGIANIATKGKLIVSAKKGEAFIKSKIPKVMSKNYVIDRARQAASGIDDLYEGITKEYDALYEKIGQKQIIGENLKRLNDTLQELPDSILNKISKSNLLSRTKSGEVVPDLQNLKAIKSIIRKSVPQKVWSGKAIGDMNTAQLEQAYGEIADIMSEGNDELVALNQKYGQFRQMQKNLNSVLYDANGDIKSKGLENLFKGGAERNKQQFFDKFIKQWPRAKQIMKDIIKYNRRQTVKKYAGRGILAGGLLYGAKRAVNRPIEQVIYETEQ